MPKKLLFTNIEYVCAHASLLIISLEMGYHSPFRQLSLVTGQITGPRKGKTFMDKSVPDDINLRISISCLPQLLCVLSVDRTHPRW